MAALSMLLKQPNFICFCTCLWLSTVVNAGTDFFTSRSKRGIPGTMEVAALGRPLSLGMLYDCREDSFIPGVTLWDEKSLQENLESFPKAETQVKFSRSDSLSSKSDLLDVSASLKASFLGGLVNVGGSGKFLHDTKSSHRQSRVTMYYSETTIYKHLTMAHLSKITYPQVFDQKSATHVVVAVLYGAQAIMVFDRTISGEENKQEIDGKLDGMVRNIVGFYIEGKGAADMSAEDKKIAENTICTFHGDFLLEKNPTTYREALDIYKNIPGLLKANPNNVVPIKVWLHPLQKLNSNAAQLEREINARLISKIETITEVLGEAERTYNDLCRNTLVSTFSGIRGRLRLFKESFDTYKSMLLKAVGRVLPAVRGGDKEEKSLEDILNVHRSSPFNADMLNQWIDDAKSEVHILNSYIDMLQGMSFVTESPEGMEVVDSDDLRTILFHPDVDAVVCLTVTSLSYEDPYLSTLKEFLKSDKFRELDGSTFFSVESVTKWFNERSGSNTRHSVKSVTKWFNDPNAIRKMRETVSQFSRFAEANKGEPRIRFIISAIHDPSVAGSSIYLYEKGSLTDTRFQPVSKPRPPIVKNVLAQAVSLKLQRSSTGATVKYRVEYKQVKPDSGDEEPWLSKETADEEFTLTGLVAGKNYLIRCIIVGKVGVSEASDAVNTSPLAEPVIVGGTGGDEFCFKSTLTNTFQKIIISYNQVDSWFTESMVTSLNIIQVIFQDNQQIQVGLIAGNKLKEFIFDNTDKIVTATLWPNKDHTRLGGLEFVVEKNNGERKTMSLKCNELGEPVIFNVGSGRCYGVKGRSGYEIDALGFYFI